jgi:predicted RNA-binding Zn ribbon-like protein
LIFAHDTEVALAAAAALVNTGRGDDELLPDLAALDRFIAEWGFTGQRARDRAELDAVTALRPVLAQVWELTVDDAVVLVNTMLRAAGALPQLVKHDGWDYHLHATSADAPLADRMAVEAAMAFTDVIRSGELERLRRCAADDCDNVLVDLSKNRSRRFCGTTCANRVNVAAYRSRQAGRPAAG